MEKYYPAKFQEKKFHCVHCGVFSTQAWVNLEYGTRRGYASTPMWGCTCTHCNRWSYWNGESKRMLFPDESPAPPRHVDLPPACHGEYDEARSVIAKSPRAAAALLRLAIQKLMVALGEGGKNINDDIANLVAKGLPEEVQQALDICRVVGNHAVHPGEIELNDTPEVAANLFDMINFIVEDRISRPKRVAALYSRLPEKDRAAIEERNKKAVAAAAPKPKT
jgi:hypothetical protein